MASKEGLAGSPALAPDALESQGAAAAAADGAAERLGSSWAARSMTALKDLAASFKPTMEGFESGEALNGGINPVFKTYLYPGEELSRRRYMAMVLMVLAGFCWWLGPVMGFFVVDPLIQLSVTNMQVITPRTECYDYKAPYQDCDDQGISHYYYFYNITNPDEWKRGDAPPRYAEVGPFAFRAWEKRYNLAFNKNWTEVEYTYHPYYTFEPEASCPTCTLDAPLTVLNRRVDGGYQQMLSGLRVTLAASSPPPAGPVPNLNETVKALIMPGLLPPVLAGIRAGLTEGFNPYAQAFGMANATLADKQWANCWPLVASSSPSPFMLVDPTSKSAFHFPPELCYYIASNLNVSSPQTAAPALAAGAGGIDAGAAISWLNAVTQPTIDLTTGQLNWDAASQFVSRFLMLSRTTHLAYLESLNTTSSLALKASLQNITEQGWGWLQGYLMQIAATFGEEYYTYVLAPAANNPTSLIASVTWQVQAGAAYWAALATPTPATPEKALIFQSMLPATVRTVLGQLNSTVGQAGVIPQWAYCAALGGNALPTGDGAFPHPLEFCAFLMANASSVGVPGFALKPAMFGDVGLQLSPAVAVAFLEVVSGRFDQQLAADGTHPDDPYASAVAQTFITDANMTRALGVVAAMPPFAAQNATLSAGLTEKQYSALRLWLISLLGSWGQVVYRGWLEAPRADAMGLLAARPARELLYGYTDAMLRSAAQAAAAQAGFSGAEALTPWRYQPSVSISFATADDPINYFTAVTGSNLTYAQLSYRDTDIVGQQVYHHPLIQQKRMMTGQAQHSEPQMVLQYRGLPFEWKAHGILNATGLNEGIVQGPNFKTSSSPVLYESYLSRPLQATFTGNFIEVKKVSAYQYGLAPASAQPCDAAAFEAWRAEVAFDEGAYNAARLELMGLKQSNPAAYWALMQDPAALANHFSSHTDLGPLSQYFNSGTPQEVLRCLAPEPAPFAWDFSDTYACPSLHTLPRFYLGGAEVAATTGDAFGDGAPLQGNFKDHGWYFSVEPFTGWTIQGHKGYQFNHLVQRTDAAYPALWVAPGSANTSLGRAYGMAADFVTVPIAYVVISWEPTDSTALALRATNLAKEVLYWLLIVGFPCGGWVFLFPILVSLRFTKAAKLRRIALARILKSTARPPRLGRHEMAMAEALTRLARGSKVVLPLEHDDSDDDTAASERASVAGSGAGSPAAVAGYKRGASEISIDAKAGGPGGAPGRSGAGTPSRLSHYEAKVAAAERQQQRAGALSMFERAAGGGAGDQPDAFSIAAALPAPAGQHAWGQAQEQAPAAPEQQLAMIGEEAGGGSPDVAVTLLPPGALASSSAADRAALEAYRRSTGGAQLHSGRGSLRRRTTSTSNPEEP